MGDVVFAPLYQVLRRRGVHFRFFHQVKNITLNPNNKNYIERVTVIKQVEMTGTEYEPLITVKNLPSWPSEPKYEMINPDQVKLLREYKVNLESFWSDWPRIYKNYFKKDIPLVQLQRGRDFDKVIYGISIGSLPHLCAELLSASDKLKDAHYYVKTVATQAFQLWTDTSLLELGWKSKTDAFLAGWGEPLDAYAAMNQVLAREDWSSQGKDPKHVGYFCSQLKLKPSDFPPQNNSSFPHKMADIVKQNALEKLKHARDIWPNSFENGHFNWTVLTSPNELKGIEKFNSQFWRANIDPSELYVQSAVNSSRHRIATHGAGFSNLYFTGDWIRNEINMGCIEGAVSAALQTAKAVNSAHKEC